MKLNELFKGKKDRLYAHPELIPKQTTMDEILLDVTTSKQIINIQYEFVIDDKKQAYSVKANIPGKFYAVDSFRVSRIGDNESNGYVRALISALTEAKKLNTLGMPTTINRTSNIADTEIELKKYVDKNSVAKEYFS